MISLATNKIDFKRGWSNKALQAFKEGKDNLCLMFFSVGLIESGFKKYGEYAGVERWYLADTEIFILVNTNNFTWGFDNQCPYPIRESKDFFDIIRRVWAERTRPVGQRLVQDHRFDGIEFGDPILGLMTHGFHSY